MNINFLNLKYFFFFPVFSFKFYNFDDYFLYILLVFVRFRVFFGVLKISILFLLNSMHLKFFLGRFIRKVEFFIYLFKSLSLKSVKFYLSKSAVVIKRGFCGSSRFLNIKKSDKMFFIFGRSPNLFVPFNKTLSGPVLHFSTLINHFPIKELEIKFFNLFNKISNEKNVSFETLLTLQYPIPVDDLSVFKVKENITHFFYLYKKYFKKKKINIDIQYFYSIEVMCKTRFLHMHILCNIKEKDLLYLGRVFWFKILKKNYNNLIFFEQNSNHYKQMLHVSIITDYQYSLKKIFNYLIKNIASQDEELINLKEKLNYKFLLGGSHIFTKELLFPFFKDRGNIVLFSKNRIKTEEEKIPISKALVVVPSCNDKNSEQNYSFLELMFRELLRQEPVYREFEKALVIDELEKEFNFYNVYIKKYDYNKLDESDLKGSSNFMKLRFLLKKLSQLTYPKFLSYYNLEKNSWERLASERLLVFNILDSMFSDDHNSFHYFNLLSCLVQKSFLSASQYFIINKLFDYIYPSLKYLIPDDYDGLPKLKFLIITVFLSCVKKALEGLVSFESEELFEEDNSEEALLGHDIFNDDPTNIFDCNLDLKSQFSTKFKTKYFSLNLNFDNPFWKELNLKSKDFLFNTLLKKSMQGVFKVIPKNWNFETNVTSKDAYIFSGSIRGGGPLLNNLILPTEKSPLISIAICENRQIGARHIFKISPFTLRVVDKIQKIPYKLDFELFSYLKKKLNKLPNFLTKKKKLEILNNISNIKKKLKVLFNDKSSTMKRLNLILIKYDLITSLLDKNKTINFSKLNALFEDFSRSPVDRRINSVDLKEVSVLTKQLNFMHAEINQLLLEKRNNQGALDKSKHLELVLSLFEDTKKEDLFYYPLKLDFRGRIYPMNSLVHPMGSLISRALVRFNESADFSLQRFKKFAVSCCIKTINLSDLEVFVYFETKVKELLVKEDDYILEHHEEFEEPFLLVACAFEYKKYLNSKKNNVNYMSNMPIYLDATSSGPQLISIMFTLEQFASFLNLCSQVESTTQGDFYSGILEKFVLETFKTKSNIIPYNFEIKEGFLADFYKLLRKIFKNLIMTQFYGVSWFKFYNDSYNGFLTYKESFIKFLNFSLKDGETFNDIYFDNFVKNFIKSFWNFLKSLPLFQLGDFLNYVQKTIKPERLKWSMLINEITLDYGKVKTDEYSIRTSTSKVKYVERRVVDGYSSKNRTSAMANFIHSIDAYVMTTVLSRVDYPIFMIHDSWGQAGVNCERTFKIVNDVYCELVENGFLFNHLVNNMRQLIETSVAQDSKDIILQDYDKFIKTLKTEKLDAKMIQNSRYFIS